MMAGVIRQLVNAGIPYEQIPQEWAAAIVAASLKWLTGSQEGVEDNLARLQLECFRGSSEKSYFVTDENETFSTEVKPEDVTFVRGAIANGSPIPLKRLSISEKERAQCDDCGIVSHCLVDVRDPSTDKIKSLCNNCVTYNDHPRIKDLGGRDKCERCSVLNCAHHPHKQKQLLLTR